MAKVITGCAVVIALCASPANSQFLASDQPQRTFPIFVPAEPPSNCVLPTEDRKHLREKTGWSTNPDPDRKTPSLEREQIAYPPFQRLICGSAVLQAHYVRRERRSEHFSSALDVATLGASMLAVGLAGFGAGAKAILAAGLVGGGIAVGRNYKAPEARQRLYRKGEEALQCIDRQIRATDRIYAEASGAESVKMFSVVGSPKDIDDIEAAAMIIVGTPGGDEEFDALRTAASQVLELIRSLRVGPDQVAASYNRVGNLMIDGYQATRAPIDFGKAVESLKQDIAIAQAKKQDDKKAGENLTATGADTKNQLTKSAKAEKAALKSDLETEIQAMVKNPKMRTLPEIRGYFMRLLSSRYDPVRTLKSELTTCETMLAV